METTLTQNKPSRWTLIIWVFSALAGNAASNYSEGHSLFQIFDFGGSILVFISHLVGDIAKSLGFSMLGLGLGIVLAFIVKIFAKQASFWEIALTVGIIVNSVVAAALFGVFN